jgi:predicted transcriptional regulator
MEFAGRKLRTADSSLSTELVTAVYGTAARTQIIRHLRVNGPSIRCDIADATGLSHGLVAQSPNKLRRAGVVTTEPVRNATTARIKAYSLDAARAEDLLTFSRTTSTAISRILGGIMKAAAAEPLPKTPGLHGPHRTTELTRALSGENP